MKANFLNPGSYKFKFNKDPRKWTIEELHDLYLRTKERNKKYSKIFTKFIDDIFLNIDKNSRDEYVVYFNQKEQLRQYNISYNERYGSYSFHSEIVSLKNRQDRLEFILSNQIAFDMGEKFLLLKSFSDGSRDSMLKVKSLMWNCVENKLKDNYKLEDNIFEKIIMINISDKQYFAQVNNNFGYGSYSFKFFNEMDSKPINVSDFK